MSSSNGYMPGLRKLEASYEGVLTSNKGSLESLPCARHAAIHFLCHLVLEGYFYEVDAIIMCLLQTEAFGCEDYIANYG